MTNFADCSGFSAASIIEIAIATRHWDRFGWGWTASFGSASAWKSLGFDSSASAAGSLASWAVAYPLSVWLALSWLGCLVTYVPSSGSLRPPCSMGATASNFSLKLHQNGAQIHQPHHRDLSRFAGSSRACAGKNSSPSCLAVLCPPFQPSLSLLCSSCRQKPRPYFSYDSKYLLKYRSKSCPLFEFLCTFGASASRHPAARLLLGNSFCWQSVSLLIFQTTFFEFLNLLSLLQLGVVANTPAGPAVWYCLGSGPCQRLSASCRLNSHLNPPRVACWRERLNDRGLIRRCAAFAWLRGSFAWLLGDCWLASGSCPSHLVTHLNCARIECGPTS